MPTSIAPIVTTQATPIVSVTGASGTSYAEIQASIGTSFNYLVKNIYQKASSFSQLLQPVKLRKFNKYGDKHEMNLQMMIDPYQDQSSLNQSLMGLDYIFDSNNAYFASIEGNTSVNYRIDVETFGQNDLMGGQTNFDDIEFLQDYINDF
jgi:hypothetical protein